MNNAIFNFENPQNEPIKGYEVGSKERESIVAELNRMSNETIEIPLIIGGKEVYTGTTSKVVMPHNHQKTLAIYHQATEKEVQLAIDAALKAKKQWEAISWIERGAILLRVAELMAKEFRPLINAATMLGQSKTVFQAEIDSACETIDFLRYNTYFASQIYNQQPKSDCTQLNRLEYRPLEGFVFAVSPFNFTSIATNLNTAPVMMGNTTVWKPASTALLSNYYLMKIFQKAGLPDGVINFVPGSGALIGNAVLKDKHLAGIHFTGSNGTFNYLWKKVAENLENYVSYPKLVGETGGKDFIIAHNSANPLEVATAIVRGAFEYQGQKCSAASRAYLPKSLWNEIKEHLISQVSQIKMGDITDFTNFIGAVIDEKSFDNTMKFIDLAKKSSECTIVTGGEGDKTVGYFIQPTVIQTTNPNFVTMSEELFAPVITVYIYDDNKFEETLELCNQTSPYALTGAIFCNDRYATLKACEILRYAAGNFYINDKPTGAVVGLQPFGGGRASGTNDKAGSHLNLLRWISPRTVKETYAPAQDFRYPFMNK